MQSNSHMFHINHNLLLHQFYNDVSSPSYLKKKQSKLKNKQTKNLAFIMSTGSSIALCLGFHKPKCLLKLFLSQTKREWFPCDISF